MEIILAKNSGFCFGVKRAINLAQEAIKKSRVPVYSFGPIIHSPQEVERLDRLGLSPIESLKGIKSGKLVVRSHGVHPNVLREARKRGMEIVDATCPLVKRAQEHARFLVKEDYKVCVVGEADHPEVLGIVGFAGKGVSVLDSPSTLGKLKRVPKLGVIAQTTLNPEVFRFYLSHLVEKTDELRVFNTICKATVVRQAATLKVAKKADIVLVVGGRNSANTTRLFELCKTNGREAHHIETADEMFPEWFKGKKQVGVTAGASTPGWVIQNVLKRLKEYGDEPPTK
jgi:(E)-4-hydroxy-3-methyl-but-2-enyl pyrophosphate reductase